MVETNVVYGCCTNSLDRVSRYVLPRIGNRKLIVMWNQTSITTAYNMIIDACRYYHTKLDMLVLIHDDLELTDPAGEEKLLNIIRDDDNDDVAIAGVAGGRDVYSLAWWNSSTVGYQLTDTCPLDFGLRAGDVDLLEGSLLALSPWAVMNLRFDENFTGFHGYDEISMAARALGKRVVVANVATHHHTGLGFESSESEKAWLHADTMFRKKYKL